MAVTAGDEMLVGVLRRFLGVTIRRRARSRSSRPSGSSPPRRRGRLPCRWCRWPVGRASGRGRLGKMGGGLGTWVRSGRRSARTCARRTRSVACQRLRGPVVISDPGVDPDARDRASEGGTLRRHAGRGSDGVLGRVRGVLPDRGVDVRRALRAADVRVRGLAVARGRSPRPRRRRARADHCRRDRGHDETRAPLAKRTILRSALGGIAFGLVGVALPLTLFTGTDQLTTVIDDGAGARRGPADRGRVREDRRVRGVRGHRLHRWAVPRDAVHRRHGRDRRPRADPGAAGGPRVHSDVRRPPRGARRGAVLAGLLAAFTTQIGTLQIAPVAIAVVTAFLRHGGRHVAVAGRASPHDRRARSRRTAVARLTMRLS